MRASPEIATALWLVPDEVAAGPLREIIGGLAAKFEAPVFAPHLTLGLGPAALLEKIESGPIELEVIGLDCASRFTKSLFLRVALSRALALLRDSLGFEAVDYDPHVSLLYAEMPLGEKEVVRATVPPVPFTHVRFVAAEAVRCSLPIATAADVNGWETIARRPLL